MAATPPSCGSAWSTPTGAFVRAAGSSPRSPPPTREPEPVTEEDSGLRHLRQKAARHWRWARQDGLSSLVEEDDLRPLSRVTRSWRKWRWRRSHTVEAGTAMPVWLVGVQ